MELASVCGLGTLSMWIILFFICGQWVSCDPDEPISFPSVIAFNRSNRFSLFYEQDIIVWPLHQIPAIAHLSFQTLTNILSNGSGSGNGSTFHLPLQRYHALSAAFLCYVSNTTTHPSYILSVLLTGVEGGADVQKGMIVWMANRNQPAIGGDPWLGVQEELPAQQGGNDLVLRGRNGRVVWRIKAAGGRLKLLGDGNLLVFDEKKKEVVWQSFDYPSDTFVMGQVLPVGYPVFSRASSTDLSSGSYSMLTRPDSRIVYSYAQGHDSVPYVWTDYAVSCNDVRLMLCAVLDFSVGMSISLYCSENCNKTSLSRATLNEVMIVGTLSNDSIAILRLQPNGDFYAYTCGRFSMWTSLQSFLATQDTDECKIPLHCGRYTTCFPSNGTCSNQCLTDSGESCMFDSNHLPGPSCGEASSAWKMGTITGRSYLSNGYDTPMKVSRFQECADLCYYNCSCTASFYDPEEGGCFLITTQVLHLTYTSNSSYLAFIKMPSSTSRSTKALFIAILLSVFAFLVFLLLIATVLIYRKRKKPLKCKARRKPNLEGEVEMDLDDDEFLGASLQGITRYSYGEIRSMTDGFASEIGRGAFGCVYEGLLPSNQQIKVAVKILDRVSRQGSKEFRAEVAVLAGTSHWNLLKLFGFCVEGSHKVLVYELMPNGSLDSWLFRSYPESATTLLQWAARFLIAIGVGNGLAYLHEGCSRKIIHLDIKPQNILLDHNFNAKVGDFGLSRLMDREESFAVSTMRGTPGYLAPEWLLEGGITDKIDVYSFGMVLLELVSGRKNYIPELSQQDKRYFPAWAFEKVKGGEDMQLIDPMLHAHTMATTEEHNQMKRVIKVAFLCIQEDPKTRPRMSSIVKMLEGEENVPQPNLDRNIHHLFQSRAQIMPDTTNSVSPVSLSLSYR